MSDFAPMGYAVAILLFFGLAVPFCISPFVDLSNVSPSPLVQPLVDVINTDFILDILILEINLNPFSWIGDSFRLTLSNSLSFTGFYPVWAVSIVLILCLLAIIYSIIKALPTT